MGSTIARPRTTGSRTTGSRTTGPRTTGPRTTGSRKTGPRTTGPLKFSVSHLVSLVGVALEALGMHRVAVELQQAAHRAGADRQGELVGVIRVLRIVLERVVGGGGGWRSTGAAPC